MRVCSMMTGTLNDCFTILDLAEKNGSAKDDNFIPLRACILQAYGKPDLASALRMEKIRNGSRNAAIYADEAKELLATGNVTDVFKILDLYEVNGCANDYITAIRTNALILAGKHDEANVLRMERIQAGSRNGAFYADEARVRLDADNIEGAIEILDLAEKNGCVIDNYLVAMRAKALMRK